jgi:DNA-binding NarL/FixJ family response regulator
VQIIILTSFGEDDMVFPAIRAGAQGYLLKNTPPIEIAEAIRDAAEGQMPLHPDVVKKLIVNLHN